MRRVAWVVLAGCGRLDFAERPPERVEVPATVAACIDPMKPDPASCESLNGARQLVVDLKDATTMDPWYGYVRFDLPEALRGRHVAAVTLEMTATDGGQAGGGSTGVVWSVPTCTL